MSLALIPKGVLLLVPRPLVEQLSHCCVLPSIPRECLNKRSDYLLQAPQAPQELNGFQDGYGLVVQSHVDLASWPS
jgi:hypothetical protein